jgi:stage II sporulation protein D
LVFAVALLLIILILFIVPEPGGAGPASLRLRFFPSEPEIRVLVASLARGENVVFGGRRVRVATGAQGTRILPAGVLEIASGGVRLGRTPVEMPARLIPEADLLSINGLQYPGVFDLVPDTDRVLLVNRVPLEAYLEGVVAAEMGPRFHEEALKAQAVTSRSYAVSRMLRRRDRLFDVGDDQTTQVYRGLPAGRERFRRAVLATRGHVLAFKGEVVEGLFSSACGGTTRPAGEAFGGATVAPLEGATCGHCDSAPGSRWTASAPAGEAGRALGIGGPVTEVGPVGRYASGRLKNALLAGPAGGFSSVPASRLRQIFGPDAKSAWITRLFLNEGHLVAEGKGFGHGVGLCQYGAEDLAARSGIGWRAILDRYFPAAGLALAY